MPDSKSTGAILSTASKTHSLELELAIVKGNVITEHTEAPIDVVVQLPLPEACCERCRICLLSGGLLVDLQCSCKGGLGLVHKTCAEIWFAIKGEKKCEICQSVPRNAEISSSARLVARIVLQFVEAGDDSDLEEEGEDSAAVVWERYQEFARQRTTCSGTWNALFTSGFVASVASLVFMCTMLLALYGVLFLRGPVRQ